MENLSTILITGRLNVNFNVNLPDKEIKIVDMNSRYFKTQIIFLRKPKQMKQYNYLNF